MMEGSPGDQKPLPPGLYEGGYAHSADAVQLAMQRFGIKTPATLYYPGSSTDVSLVGIEGVRVIHADLYASDQDKQGFELIGSELYDENAYTWTPPAEVDIVTFINASGMHEPTIVERANLRPGALVLSAAYWGPPYDLHESEVLEIQGVITADEEGNLTLDEDDLEDYFAIKAYNELTDEEREDFIDRFKQYLKQYELETDMTDQEVYEYLQEKDPETLRIVNGMAYRYPNKRLGEFFIFRYKG